MPEPLEVPSLALRSESVFNVSANAGAWTSCPFNTCPGPFRNPEQHQQCCRNNLTALACKDGSDAADKLPRVNDLPAGDQSVRATTQELPDRPDPQLASEEEHVALPLAEMDTQDDGEEMPDAMALSAPPQDNIIVLASANQEQRSPSAPGLVFKSNYHEANPKLGLKRKAEDGCSSSAYHQFHLTNSKYGSFNNHFAFFLQPPLKHRIAKPPRVGAILNSASEEEDANLFHKNHRPIPIFGELMPEDDTPQEDVGLLGEKLPFPGMILSTRDAPEITKALGVTSQEVTKPGALGLANPCMNLNGSGIASGRDVYVCYDDHIKENYSMKEYSLPMDSLHFD